MIVEGYEMLTQIVVDISLRFVHVFVTFKRESALKRVILDMLMLNF